MSWARGLVNNGTLTTVDEVAAWNEEQRKAQEEQKRLDALKKAEERAAEERAAQVAEAQEKAAQEKAAQNANTKNIKKILDNVDVNGILPVVDENQPEVKQTKVTANENDGDTSVVTTLETEEEKKIKEGVKENVGKSLNGLRGLYDEGYFGKAGDPETEKGYKRAKGLLIGSAIGKLLGNISARLGGRDLPEKVMTSANKLLTKYGEAAIERVNKGLDTLSDVKNKVYEKFANLKADTQALGTEISNNIIKLNSLSKQELENNWNKVVQDVKKQKIFDNIDLTKQANQSAIMSLMEFKNKLRTQYEWSKLSKEEQDAFGRELGEYASSIKPIMDIMNQIGWGVKDLLELIKGE